MAHIEILFAVHRKHSSYWPSADVKPMSNNLVHAMTWQCMFALSIIILQYLCLESTVNHKQGMEEDPTADEVLLL